MWEHAGVEAQRVCCVASVNGMCAVLRMRCVLAQSGGLGHDAANEPEAPGVVAELLLLDQRQLLPPLRVQERLLGCWSLPSGQQPHPHRAEDQCEGEEGDLPIDVRKLSSCNLVEPPHTRGGGGGANESVPGKCGHR